MDLFDWTRSVIDIGLWVVSFAAAGVAAWGVWKSMQWGDPGSRPGWSGAVFVVVLLLMAGLVRPALEKTGQPEQPRHFEPNPNSQYGR